MSKTFFRLLLVSVTLFAGFSCIPISASASDSTFVTLYQNAPAQIVIAEEVKVDKGLNNFTKELSSSAIQDTFFVNCKGAWLKRMGFKSGVSSEATLLNNLLGKKILVVSQAGGNESITEGELLAMMNTQPLIKTSSDQTVLVKNPKEYRFDNQMIPPFNGKVVLTLSAEEAVKTQLTMSYQLQNLTWSPHYAGVLDEKNDILSLKGLAYITNKTDKKFESSSLNLLAGSPERERNQGTRLLMAKESAAPATPSPQQVFEYYRYPITFPVTIDEHSQFQLLFLHKEAVKFDKQYRFVSSSSGAVQTTLELSNTEERGLGLPIARGIVRIYNNDEQKTFLGEDTVSNTPVGDNIRLNLGDTFDVQGDRTRKRHEKIADRHWEDEVEIEITNRKTESITITVRENIPGSWRILNSSHKFEVVNDNRIQFDLKVPADGTVNISYTTRYKY